MTDLLLLLAGALIGGLWANCFVRSTQCETCEDSGFYRATTTCRRPLAPDTVDPDDYDSVLCDCKIGRSLQDEGFGPTTIYSWWRDA